MKGSRQLEGHVPYPRKGSYSRVPLLYILYGKEVDGACAPKKKGRLGLERGGVSLEGVQYH